MNHGYVRQGGNNGKGVAEVGGSPIKNWDIRVLQEKIHAASKLSEQFPDGQQMMLRNCLNLNLNKIIMSTNTTMW